MLEIEGSRRNVVVTQTRGWIVYCLRCRLSHCVHIHHRTANWRLCVGSKLILLQIRWHSIEPMPCVVYTGLLCIGATALELRYVTTVSKYEHVTLAPQSHLNPQNAEFFCINYGNQRVFSI